MTSDFDEIQQGIYCITDKFIQNTKDAKLEQTNDAPGITHYSYVHVYNTYHILTHANESKERLCGME